MKRGGGLQSWNVCASPPSLCSRRPRRAAQAGSCARAARDRSGSARRTQENAAGAGNDGGDQEEGTSCDTVKLEHRGPSFGA